MIPKVSECFQLMEEYSMLDNIREHSIIVARVGELLARGMLSTGKQVSLEKTIAGALLHDIAKTACLDCNDNHAEKGREVCLKHGFHEIAEIVGEHVVLKNGVPDDCCCEREIVYYADKRVKHDKVVSLDDRLEYILERYGQENPSLLEAIRKNFDHSRQIENKLFVHLPWKPDEVEGLINGRADTLPWEYQVTLLHSRNN